MTKNIVFQCVNNLECEEIVVSDYGVRSICCSSTIPGDHLKAFHMINCCIEMDRFYLWRFESGSFTLCYTREH